jgi:hypothetical protein
VLHGSEPVRVDTSMSDGPDPPANCPQGRQHEHRHRTPVRFGRRTTAAAALAPHT